MLYNLYFNDETYNNDKLRAERIIKNINDKISNKNKSEKKDLNNDEKDLNNEDEKELVRKLIIKVLEYEFSI